MDLTKFVVNYVGYVDGHNDWVTSLVCGQTKEGKPLLISGSRDKSIIVWDLKLENPIEVKTNVEIKNKDGTKKIEVLIDKKLGKPYKSLHGHKHFISSLALSSDSKKLVSGSWDKTVRLWDLTSMKTQQLFSGHTKDVLCVGFSHDERLIFSGGMDKTLKYWNSQGELKFDNTQFKGWVSTITNIRKGKDNMMAVGSWDAKINIFGSEYSHEREVTGNDYAVTSMSADSDGEFLFVAHKNGTIKLWNLASESNATDVCKQTQETNVDINSICFETKWYQVISIGTANGLQIRDVEKGNLVYDKQLKKNCPCLSLTYDQERNYLFAGFADGSIRIFKFSNTNLPSM